MLWLRLLRTGREVSQEVPSEPATLANEAEEALQAAYEALAASENDEDRAFHAALRARRGRLSTAFRVAYDAARVLDGASADDLFLERYKAARERNLRLMLKMAEGGEVDLKLLSEIASDGHHADRLIADYYDNLTEAQWEEMFEGSEPVKLMPTVGGPRVSFGVSFSREEMHRIRKVIGDGASYSRFFHDTVMEQVAVQEHINAHFAQADQP